MVQQKPVEYIMVCAEHPCVSWVGKHKRNHLGEARMWEALGGIYDTLGIEWQTGKLLFYDKVHTTRILQKIPLDLFIQFE